MTAYAGNPHDSPVWEEIADERHFQDSTWGEQNHPDGTGQYGSLHDAEFWRARCDAKHDAGNGSWLDILFEETYEAAAEGDPVRLRKELIQVAAVAVAWVEAIDRRTK